MQECYIVCAGTLFDLPARPGEGDFVIAADGGLRVCERLGIAPSLILGDFDSLPRPEGENVLTYPVEKDDTDAMLAVKEGLSRGYRTFHIIAGTGGLRLDHTIANLQLLMWTRQQGARAYLYDNRFVYTAIQNETFLIQKQVEWGIVSLFCLSEPAKGVTFKGLQYPLHDAVLVPGLPLAVSNHILEDTAEISVREGMLVVGWQVSPFPREESTNM